MRLRVHNTLNLISIKIKTIRFGFCVQLVEEKSASVWVGRNFRKKLMLRRATASYDDNHFQSPESWFSEVQERLWHNWRTPPKLSSQPTSDVSLTKTTSQSEWKGETFSPSSVFSFDEWAMSVVSMHFRLLKFYASSKMFSDASSLTPFWAHRVLSDDGKCNFRINSGENFTRYVRWVCLLCSTSHPLLGSNYIASAVDVISPLSMIFIFCRCANWCGVDE